MIRSNFNAHVNPLAENQSDQDRRKQRKLREYRKMLKKHTFLDAINERFVQFASDKRRKFTVSYLKKFTSYLEHQK